MNRKFMIIILAILTSFLLTISLSADVPHLVRFQGKVTNKAGAPLTGDYRITVRIYDAETGGTLLWSESQTPVPVNNGVFTILMGNVTALDLPFDEPYWLSIEVNNDGEMEPRQQITSVGYAIYAEKAKAIDNVSIIPQGAAIIWFDSTCPNGYSRVAALDGKFLVAGANYSPAAGGSNTHTHGAGSYSGPSHSHSYSGTTGGAPDQGSRYDGSSSPLSTPGHTHPYSGTTNSSGTGSVSGTSSSADSRPEFATVILCRKD